MTIFALSLMAAAAVAYLIVGAPDLGGFGYGLPSPGGSLVWVVVVVVAAIITVAFYIYAPYQVRP